MSSKLWLIASREYLSRVKKRSFLLATFLTPLGFALLLVAIVLIAVSGQETRKIAILDPQDLLALVEGNHQLPDGRGLSFKRVEGSAETWRADQKDFDAILYVPPILTGDSLLKVKTVQPEYWSKEQLGVKTKASLERILTQRFETVKLKQAGLDPNYLKSLEMEVNLLPINLKDTEAQPEGNAGARVYVATFLGGAMMFLIYLVIFIYGNMVMRSVMEEKTNRIVEVIVSSVRPFDLMMGKIIGVGAVGLTQFAIWALAIPLLNLGVSLLFAGQLSGLDSAMVEGAGQPSTADILKIQSALDELSSFSYVYLFGFFLLFFIGGYLLYASLFAAVGAAMGDDWGEGQSLTLLVSIPVVIAFYVGISAVENPNSALSFWASLFPLFSPVVMPARLVFDPPWWQLFLSLGLLFMACLFFVWVSGRIYRVGILMYGKKVDIRTFFRWIFARQF